MKGCIDNQDSEETISLMLSLLKNKAFLSDSVGAT